ncbi:hypothetical protein ACIBF1_01165 [Spirillospora sp. NPDC050679]
MNPLLRGLGRITRVVVVGAAGLAAAVSADQVLNEGKWSRGGC